jgi:hypothetical protein
VTTETVILMPDETEAEQVERIARLMHDATIEYLNDPDVKWQKLKQAQPWEDLHAEHQGAYRAVARAVIADFANRGAA